MKIAVVDQHPILRTGMCVVLKEHFENLTTFAAGNLETLHASDQTNFFDVVIIGLTEEVNQIDRLLLHAVMSQHTQSAFIIYAGKADRTLAASVLRAGVQGYLVKNNSLNELISCIDAVLSGERYISGQASLFDFVYPHMYGCSEVAQSVGAHTA